MSIISSSIVELCVFKIENNKAYFLLLHRTKEEKVYPDLWQFVTGSIEKNEKAADAALRELKEETGLLAKSFWVVPYVLSFYNAEWDSVNLCPFFAAEVDQSAAITLSDEHDDYVWFEYDAAIDQLVWPSWKEGLRIVHEFIINQSKSGNMHKLF
ncbi:MAG: NUDIX pyrophosphatase [Ignavibacteriales bacterium]|nr:NUDIX pyrophosphatase [Ignavibacteriales bacterium]